MDFCVASSLAAGLAIWIKHCHRSPDCEFRYTFCLCSRHNHTFILFQSTGSTRVKEAYCQTTSPPRPRESNFSTKLNCIQLKGHWHWSYDCCGIWWRHHMEFFFALLAVCAGNSPVSGELPAQRPVTRSFDVFFDLRLNKRLSKQSWGWWF